ncbi:MAG: CotH kinase family protein, partial [Planctomycetes bacterium]|nr:CotH kinase family protein [Planctomycetota bacterium]
MKIINNLFCLTLFVALTSGTVSAADQQPESAPPDAEALFNLTQVWKFHLKFAADQWQAIEPKRNPNAGGFGRGPNDARNPSRAAELLAPVLMSQADRDRNGTLSAEEFATLGRSWFQNWDKTGAGTLTQSQFSAGFNAIRSPIGGGLPLVGAEGKRNGIASVIGFEFDYVHADLEIAGKTIADVAVRYKGNGTFLELGDNPKRSLKIAFDKFQKGQKLAGVTTLNLQNNVTDVSYMNEVLAYRLFRDAGVPAPRTTYAQVYITVAGQFEQRYFGLYSVTENVDSDFANSRFAPSQKGVFFKPVTPQIFADLGADWAPYNQLYDPKSKPTDEQKRAITELCRLATQADDREFTSRIGQFIDLPELARYMAVLVY